MTAATTQKSKPNELRSFPDPSAMRDAVAAPISTHLLHKLCINSFIFLTGCLHAHEDFFCFRYVTCNVQL